MRKSCSSAISYEQFEAIKLLLESARRKTNLRRVTCMKCFVLYPLRSRCQWRTLPDASPKRRTVNSYFAICNEPREGGSLPE